MKFMVGLSSCALVALSISPSLATNRAISSSTVRPLSHQSLPAGTKTIQVADLFDSLLRLQREEAQRAREEARETSCFRPKSAQQKRIEAAREKRQERVAEIEKQKYLKSLTPEQLEEYLARQRSTPAAAVGASSPIKVSSPEMGKNSSAPSDRDSIPESRDKNPANSLLKP